MILYLNYHTTLTGKNKRPEVLYHPPPLASVFVVTNILKVDLWWPLQIKVKSPAHLQLLRPQKIMKFIHVGHFEFQ